MIRHPLSKQKVKVDPEPEHTGPLGNMGAIFAVIFHRMPYQIPTFLHELIVLVK